MHHLRFLIKSDMAEQFDLVVVGAGKASASALLVFVMWSCPLMTVTMQHLFLLMSI